MGSELCEDSSGKTKAGKRFQLGLTGGPAHEIQFYSEQGAGGSAL